MLKNEADQLLSISNSTDGGGDSDCSSEWEQEVVCQHLCRNTIGEEKSDREKTPSEKNNGSSDSDKSKSSIIGTVEVETGDPAEERTDGIEYRDPIEKDGRYNCPYKGCGKSFSEKYQAKLHINDVHRHLNLFRCFVCGQSFPNPRRRQRHIEVKHPPKKGFECTHCRRHFLNRYSLADHVNAYHRDTKKLECEICGEDNFSRKNQLEKHIILQHTRRSTDGSFPCIYQNCVFISSTYRNFRLHLRAHKDPERQFLCKRVGCSERFVTSHARKEHEKTVHGRWVCEHCGKEYSIPYHFHKHVAAHFDIHIVEKPQCGCPFKGCNKVFSTKDSMLRQHFYPHHLKLLEFRCSVCLALFNSKGSVERHMRAVHDDKQRVNKIESIYHSPAVKSSGDVRKVFKGFELGWITYDMFAQGGGLDLERAEVNMAIEKSVRECSVIKRQGKRRLIEKQVKDGLRRVKKVTRQTMNELVADVGMELTESRIPSDSKCSVETPFTDSIEAVVAPLESTLSTASSIYLQLHKRQRIHKQIMA